MIKKTYIVLQVFALNLVCVFSQTNTITNCAQMSTDNTYCLYCNSGYFLDNLQKTCTQQGPADLFCIQKYNSICIKCDCGHLIVSDKNTCAKATYQLRGCEVINPRSQCIRPKIDYVMSQVGNDVVLRLSGGSFCEIETQQFQCLQCHSGYKLDANRNCVQVNKKIDNIFYSYFYGDQLKSRNSLYVPGDFGVYPIIQYCNQYTGSGDGLTAICTQCYDGMIPNLTQTACYVSPCNFCQFADLSTNVVVCVQCLRPNYFFVYTDKNQNQVCAPRSNFYFDNCLERNPKSDSCNTCVPSFGTPNPYCPLKLWNLQLPQNSIYGCSVYLDSSHCQLCSQGFLLSSGQCYQAPTNCVSIDSNKVCLQCSNLYYLDSSKTCQPMSNPQNCILSDGKSNQCAQCQNLFYLSSSNPITCVPISDIQCALSDGINDKKCKKCNNLYYTNSGLCKQIQEFSKCVVSDGINNQCTNCKNNFMLDSSSKSCKVNTNLQDVPGFYQDSSNKYQNYDFTNWNFCLSFVQSANKCQQCTNIYFVDTNGTCQSAQPSCFTDGNSQNCLYCAGNQYINSLNQCAASNYCSGSYLTNGVKDTCTSCSDNSGQPGFYYNDNSSPSIPQCLTQSNLIIPNCASYKLDPINSIKICTICSNNYYISINTCQPITEKNCQYSDGVNDQCLVCLQGYYIQNNKCKPLSPIPFCINTGQVFCSQCQNLYYINSNTGLCYPISNPNCQQSNGFQDSCQVCQPDYNYIDLNYPNYCGFPFCDIWNQQNPSSGCTKCKNGYYLTKQGSCSYITLSNCLAQNSDQECTLCDGSQKYYLAQMSYGGVICLQLNDQNCKITDGINPVCTQCNPNYYPGPSGICLTIQNCQTLDPVNGICTQCNISYIPSSDQTQCIQILNCQNTDGKNCIQCKDGFYLTTQNGQNACIQIRNCSSNNNNNGIICTSCQLGFTILNYQCVPSQSQPIICQDPCPPSFSSIQCQQCQQSSTIQYSSGDQCFIKYKNSSNQFNCLYCSQAAYLQQNSPNSPFTCLQRNPPTINCQLYNFSSNNDCILCPPLMYLDSNSCKNLSTSDCIYSYGIKNECLNCQKMKYFKKLSDNNYLCSSVANSNVQIGCKIYDNQENCIQCYENHYLSGTGTCLPRTLYDNCLTYYPDQDQCQICQPGFYLKQNNKNPFGYFQPSNTYVLNDYFCMIVDTDKIIINCIQYDENQKCVKCKNTGLYGPLQEYYLDKSNPNDIYYCIDITDKQCQKFVGTNCQKKYIFQCQNYDSNFNCLQCNAGYYLNSSGQSCEPYTAQNCAQYDPKNDQCISCISSYFFDSSNKCLLQITNCYSANNQKCTQCIKDYTLDSSNICQSNVGANCMVGYGTYDTTKNQFPSCQQCNIGYALTSDKTLCIPYYLSIANCKILKSLTKKYYECDQCIDNFFYSKGQNECLQINSLCSIPNCQTYDTQDSYQDYYFCQQCQSPYYVNQAARCSQDPPPPSPTSDNLPDPVISSNLSKIIKFCIYIAVILVL
ncbi:hypothetical protein TTHERM_00218220 (macronuclear) [Tetrahymena thermophila SB210]|uniref:Transmembrane protein n=1 Tax=Tetrahymena thermophila (strain SB210) TaxID=312017 RepID=I7M2E7_TETTS|nr:hypothetical protein TTHERM_00218220 [Tetrahymena thermophila SB210]EAS00249.2 hypothetical protein TTHERM_00218220 [Tetrahymena thermophila SB210]|eukprot:XP_001020494.2 hypothetical protein TTHERM_00218220 [Tetrahymena thermophila SB210]